MLDDFKKKVDAATDYIVSCWDENNDDDLTFDERIKERIHKLNPDVKEIVQNSIDWCDEYD